MKQINFEKHVLRKQISSRGGGIEISLSRLGFKGEKMAAYQNYLGGGLLGAIGVNDTIRKGRFTIIPEKDAQRLDAIGDQLKRYFHSLTNPDPEDQPWESMTYEKNQKMPERAY